MQQSNSTYNELSKTGVVHQITVHETKFYGKTKFQTVALVRTEAYGEACFIDGQMQSATNDEFIYHESLVHPAMFTHPNPKRVFIGGGGEGATAREVLRHASVEEVVMVDIDGEFLEVAKQHMGSWHQGAFCDPRLRLVVDDARKTLLTFPNGYFDIIILDLCDPLDFGPCYALYSSEFYDECYQKMGPDGVFVTQSACANPDSLKEVFAPVYSTLKASSFDHVFPYTIFVPSFIDEWGFTMACKESQTTGVSRQQLDSEDIKTIDQVIAGRKLSSEGDFQSTLQHYDGITHRRMFSMCKWARKAMAEEKRVICEKTPIYVTHIKAATNAADRLATSES